MSTKETHQQPSSDSDHLSLRLHHSLRSYSSAVQNGDIGQSESLIRELSELLLFVSDAAVSDPENKDSTDEAISVLLQIHSYLSDPNLDQAVIDALSFELPKSVAEFSGVSNRCQEIVDDIIDLFTTKCSPRDLIPVFCEAIDSFGKTTDAPGYLNPLLRGLSKAVLSIRRRHFEQLKTAVPVVLNALKTASVDHDDRVRDSKDLFQRALGFAFSLRETCDKLDGRVNEQLRALLGLFILQIMALVPIRLGEEFKSCVSLVSQLQSLFPYCRLSYIDLITGRDANKLVDLIVGVSSLNFTDDSDCFLSCFPYVKQGAGLSVIWAHISDEVAQSADQNLSGMIDELRSVQTRRWQAIETMAHIFSMDYLPWKLKRDAVDFLLIITENVDEQKVDENIICSFHTPGIVAALQALMKVIMYSPDVSLKKNALTGLKRVLSDHPASLRLDILQVLMRNSTSSSMIAILFDCAREILQKNYRKQTDQETTIACTPWSHGVLDLVELVLRPPSGGPPSLPEQIDAILSALNLYRYVLIAESTGGTNYSGALSKSSLEKVYNVWLLPLRSLVTGMVAESRSDSDEISMDILCGLNPVEFVLYRCIELVEDMIKLSTR
ncbi:hypothetical protein V2J09_000517 [Rumex salicifolius]